MTFVSVGCHICKCDLCEVTEAATTLWGKQQHVKEQGDILEKCLRTSTPSARRASSRGTVKTWPAVFLSWSMQRGKNERWLQEEQQAVPLFKSLDRRSSQIKWHLLHLLDQFVKLKVLFVARLNDYGSDVLRGEITNEENFVPGNKVDFTKISSAHHDNQKWSRSLLMPVKHSSA